MTFKESQTHVGYSIFDSFEDCFDYNENACFIASTRAKAIEFAESAFGDMRGRRIVDVSFADVMNDFGVSCGEYAMELDAFHRFKRVADLNGRTIYAKPYDCDETLIVVDLHGFDDDDDATCPS
jgi:hypothetical protein